MACRSGRDGGRRPFRHRHDDSAAAQRHAVKTPDPDDTSPNFFKEDMKVAFRAGLVSLSLAATLGGMSVLAQTAPPIVKASSMTFRCDSSASGECAFLLYSSECKEGGLKNDHPVLLCTHEFLSEFSLKAGQSKAINNLPPNVKQCNLPPNVKPKFPDCVRLPN
jgi:hypothetical protein